MERIDVGVRADVKVATLKSRATWWIYTTISMVEGKRFIKSNHRAPVLRNRGVAKKPLTIEVDRQLRKTLLPEVHFL